MQLVFLQKAMQPSLESVHVEIKSKYNWIEDKYAYIEGFITRPKLEEHNKSNLRINMKIEIRERNLSRLAQLRNKYLLWLLCCHGNGSNENIHFVH